MRLLARSSWMVRLNGRRILVREDEYFLAKYICAVPRRLGADMIGPAGEAVDAIGIVKSGEVIDAAVLDVNPKDVSILPVADRLRAQHLFRFHDGLRQELDRYPLQGHPAVRKADRR